MRIVIAEDSALFREGLASLLEDAGHIVVGRVARADTLLDVVARHKPDLVVVDIRMPPGMEDDGAIAASQLREEHPEMGIMLLSQHIETRHSVDLVRRGRFGYLLKDRVLDVDDFLDALDRVGRGGSALDPEVVRSLVTPSAPDDPLRLLTAREAEVLQQMAEGRTNRGIAGRLYLSERTVETHIASIFDKLGLAGAGADDHRRVLAVLAYRRGDQAPSAQSGR